MDPDRRRAARLQSVDPSVGRIHASFVVAEVIHLLVIPVTDVEGPIRPDLDVHRTEPPIVAGDRMTEIMGPEGGLFRKEFAQDDSPLKRFHAEEPTGIPRRQGPVVIDDEIVGEPRNAVVGHRRKITEGVGIGEGSVFLEAFLKIGALLIVEAPRVSAVVARENPPAVIDLAAEGVPAAFREHFVHPPLGMVAPDVLTLRIVGLGIERFSVGPMDPNVGRHRAALCPVEPSVGTPAQRIGHAMGVLQTEA